MSIYSGLFKSAKIVIIVVVYKDVLCFPNYCNQMLCTILARLQVDISTHIMSLNFCKYQEKHIRQKIVGI
jgi:hypothetical protein